MSVLRAEISFAVAAIDIENERAPLPLKRLLSTITEMRKTTAGLRRDEGAGGFLWQVFAGWNPVIGYQERDFFEDMIQAIERLRFVHAVKVGQSRALTRLLTLQLLSEVLDAEPWFPSMHHPMAIRAQQR